MQGAQARDAENLIGQALMQTITSEREELRPAVGASPPQLGEPSAP